MVSIAHGDILIGFKNMKSWWDYDTNGVWYKRFSRDLHAITDIGFISGRRHYIFNEEPIEVMSIDIGKYIILFKDRLQVLTIKGGGRFSISNYPLHTPIYDICMVKNLIIGKTEDSVKVLSFEQEREEECEVQTW